MKRTKSRFLYIGAFGILIVFLFASIASASTYTPRTAYSNRVSFFGSTSSNDQTKTPSIFKRTDTSNLVSIPTPVEDELFLAGNSSNGGNGGNTTPPTINLNLYIDPMFINIEGDDIFQANSFSAEQSAGITQEGELNIAAIVQNIVQVGVNMNVSPQINVLLVGEQVVAPDVVVNTPDITVEVLPGSEENGEESGEENGEESGSEEHEK